MAYNWLLGRFVNPRFNHRNDKYGGNTENRTRIVTEIIRRIKDKTNLLHVGTKFTFFTEIDSEEYSVKECVAVCKELEKASIDSIEVLGDHSRRELGTKYESCYLDLAKAVKSKIKNTSIILTGNNHNLEKLNEILKSEDADFFGLSRPLLNEPDLPLRWQKGDKSNSKCVSCNQCYKNLGKRCIKNKT